MDDLTYVAPPGGRTGHLIRPRESWGKGDAFAQLARSQRGPQTFCGRPVSDDWEPVNDSTPRCGTCVRAEFAEE